MWAKCAAVVLTVALCSLFIAMAAITAQTAVAWKDSRDFYRAHAAACWIKP